MKWSELKQQVEARFADTVRSHAAIHITRYGPGESETMTRGWLTWDGAEVLSFSTLAYLHAEHAATANLPPTDSSDTLRDQLHQDGIFSRFDLTDALAASLSLSIEAALSAPDPLIRAIAMFDRRMGKRRLRQIMIDATTHPVVKQCYDLRCRAEQLDLTDTNHPD